MARAAQVAIDEVEVPVEESPPQKVSRRKLILIASAALFLLGAIVGAGWYFMDDSEAPEAKASVARTFEPKAASKGKEKEVGKAQDRKPPVFMNLETFTVNLQADPGDRYLQTTIVFELSDEKTTEAIKAQMPVVRSALLLLLSSKNPAELNAPGGKEKLAGEIMDAARRHFTSKPPEQVLLNVHFNAFVIQ
jgi:flagellar FliL protein